MTECREDWVDQAAALQAHWQFRPHTTYEQASWTWTWTGLRRHPHSGTRHPAWTPHRPGIWGRGMTTQVRYHRALQHACWPARPPTPSVSCLSASSMLEGQADARSGLHFVLVRLSVPSHPATVLPGLSCFTCMVGAHWNLLLQTAAGAWLQSLAGSFLPRHLDITWLLGRGSFTRSRRMRDSTT